MGSFLLNDMGEVLLELNVKMDFDVDLLLEVNEGKHKAILKNAEQSFVIDFIHPELIVPLKQNRYLFVVERNNQFYAINSKLAKVVFVN
ncbi:MAG: hypothetical protein IJZ30_05685 [Alphaproteobacteria bacterium]|nr:hypothetical protein [Alphaproteobacteria bacterium]